MKPFWKKVAKRRKPSGRIVMTAMSGNPSYYIEQGDLFAVSFDGADGMHYKYIGPVPRKLMKALGDLRAG